MILTPFLKLNEKELNEKLIFHVKVFIGKRIPKNIVFKRHFERLARIRCLTNSLADYFCKVRDKFQIDRSIGATAIHLIDTYISMYTYIKLYIPLISHIILLKYLLLRT